MKWVKCVNNGNYSDIIVGKIYKVIYFEEEISITGEIRKRIGIINEFDGLDYWLMEINDKKWFEDVTAEIRENQILKV